MPVPFWAGRYIGLTFREHGRDRSGLDCWGLVRLVLAEQAGIALPSFSNEYTGTADHRATSAIVERETATSWRRVAETRAALFDVVVLRMRGAPSHVGLVLGDTHMLHIERGIDSAIENYASARWASRIYGFYRYRISLDDLEGFDEDAE